MVAVRVVNSNQVAFLDVEVHLRTIYYKEETVSGKEKTNHL